MGTSYTAKLRCIVVAGLLFLALVADCLNTESEVKNSTPNLDPKPSVKLNTTNNHKVHKDGSKQISDSKVVDSAKSDKVQSEERSKDITVQNNSGKRNPSESAESKADDKERISGGDVLSGGVKLKQQVDDERSNNNGDNQKAGKEVRQGQRKEPDGTKLENKGGNEGSSSLSKISSVESGEDKVVKLKVEECDSSNMCVDDKRNLVACLRVPGNESPDLSLLIQNKAKKPLTIKISAPASVQLEKTEIELEAKADKKVKVSLGEDDGTNNLIILTTQDGRCALDFKDLIAHNSQTGPNYTYKFTYLRKFTRSHFYVAFIAVTALLLVASAFACVGLRRKFFFSHRYQLLDMEQQPPVSGGGGMSKSMEAELKDDGWDSNWGDAWDVEEAPMTPTLPVTPSVSSKGLAARRLCKEKEGWKD